MTTLCASTTPNQPEMGLEARRAPRFRCSLDITCEIRAAAGMPSATPARIRNLSPMGVCLVVDTPIDPRSMIHLELRHRWREVVCGIEMRVVYTIRRCNGTFLVGGAFARPLDPEEADRLLPRPMEELETEEVGDAIVAKFPAYSRLDDAAIQTVDEQLSTIAEEWGDRPVILNLCRVAGLNSSMIRQIAAFNRRVTGAGGRLSLCAVTPEVQEVLSKTHISSVLRIFPTEREALQAS